MPGKFTYIATIFAYIAFYGDFALYLHLIILLIYCNYVTAEGIVEAEKNDGKGFGGKDWYKRGGIVEINIG